MDLMKFTRSFRAKFNFPVKEGYTLEIRTDLITPAKLYGWSQVELSPTEINMLIEELMRVQGGRAWINRLATGQQSN